MGDLSRVAVVGVGRMGRLHAGVLADLPEVELVGVVDADAAAARRVAGDLGVEAIDWTELPSRTDVHGWVVATPTATHAAVVESGLAAGADILCEKPLTLDRQTSKALASMADASGRILQVGFWRRSSPPWSAAKRILDDGIIGRPLLLRLSQWDADPPPPTSIDPSVSGGLAIDCGVHEFDLAEWLTGKRVIEVQATNLPVVANEIGLAGDVDNLLAVLHLQDGVAAMVDLSRNCRYGDDVRTEILGEEGAIFVDMFPTSRTRLATAAGVEVVTEDDDAFGNGLAEQARVFAGRIRGESGDHPDAASSIRAVTIGRAVQRAAATGGTVAIPS